MRILCMTAVLAIATSCAARRHPAPSVPFVIAHRGASIEAPENTLVAYRRAIAMGAQMAECDVYLTRDRVPVLLHDESLARTTGVDRRIGDVTWEEVRGLDAGRWKGERYAGERVPKLTEALELVRDRLRLVIEIKPKGIESEVVDAIDETGTQPEDVMIFSFHHSVIVEIGRLQPRLPRTWLIKKLPAAEAERGGLIDSALEAGCSAIGVSKKAVDSAILERAHRSGLKVFSWTVNDRPTMRRLADMGIDGIITDAPDVLIEVLGR